MTIEDLIRSFDQMNREEQAAFIEKIRKARSQFVREKLAIRTATRRVSKKESAVQKLLEGVGDVDF